MILGQRAYEANSRVVKAADEMLRRSTTWAAEWPCGVVRSPAARRDGGTARIAGPRVRAGRGRRR